MKKFNYIASAKRTFKIESNAISSLASQIDINFTLLCDSIRSNKGKFIIMGVGKSGHIGQKISATLSSTGTGSIFIHPTEAAHGDMGLIEKKDIVFLISNSGETDEIINILPSLKRSSHKLASLTSNNKSSIALASDISIVIKSKEACPLDLAPTSSTTSALAFGDALAIALLESKGFTSNDFAKFHPGGSLGKKLFLKVKDLVNTDFKPMVGKDDNIKDVIIEISQKMLGITPVLSKDSIVGVITDGDLRRTLLDNQEISSLKAEDIMSINPQVIDLEVKAADALETMKSNKISQLIVTKDSEYYGILHIQNLIKEGIS